MTMPGQVTFYGASSHSRAIALLIGLPPARPQLCNVVAFVDDTVNRSGDRLEDRPVISWETWQLDYAKLPCLVPIGNCVDKRRLVTKVSAAGGVFPQLYEGAHTAGAGVSVGYGTIICPSGYIGPNTLIGDHVQIMPMHCIGHDVSIGHFATIAPSVTISGHVAVGEGVFIGSGATIVNGKIDRRLSIGMGAIVAAGAVVTKSVAPGAKVMGNPARTLRDLARSRRSR